MPHPPHSPDLTLRNFSFVSPDEKSPQRETFCPCGRGETKKKAEALKGSKSTTSKTSELWKNVLQQMESMLKVTEV